MRFKWLRLLVCFYVVMLLIDLRSTLFSVTELAGIKSWASDRIWWFTDPHSIAITFTSNLSFFLYTLAAYSILFKTQKIESKVFIRFPLIVVIAFLTLCLRYFLEEIIVKAIFGHGNYAPDYTKANYFLDNFYYAMVFTAVGVIFYYVQYSRYKEQQQQSLMLENKKTELAFLRSQINPHFLFNSLNNIYSLSHLGSKKAPEAIDKLSRLLSYSIYEKQAFVPISKEIDHLNNFIELQSMRYDYELALELDISSELGAENVPPLLFIPIVENAFKHGDLSKAADPVSIRIDREADRIFFRVENLIREAEKDKAGGVGLNNTRKRLELIYGEQHELTFTKNENHFIVEMKIPV